MTGQLQAITCSTNVKSPAGGKVAAVFFQDGELVKKGQLLVRFATREAADQKAMLTRLIELENRDLESALNLQKQQQAITNVWMKQLRKQLRMKNKQVLDEFG